MLALAPERRKKRVSSSCSVKTSAGRISVTRGSPLVMVPVLSRATIWVRPVCSREAAVLNSMPFFAPRPLPTMMATGVARPSAQGQLMTSTEMPRASAKPMSAQQQPDTMVVTTAMVMTAGTKCRRRYRDFGNGCLGGCGIADHLDDLGQRGILAHAGGTAAQKAGLVDGCGADAVAFGLVHRDALAGQGASFTALLPSSTTPSTGIFSPGRTTKISPCCTCSMGTVPPPHPAAALRFWGPASSGSLGHRWSCPWSGLPAFCRP